VTLTEQHRLRQLALRAVTLRQLLAIWPAFDLSDIDRSWPAVQQSVSALVLLRHRDSSNLAAAYYAAARHAALAGGSSTPVLAAAPPLEQLDRSLGYVGRVIPKNLSAAGRTDVAQQTLVHVSGSVSRLVLSGGRETLRLSGEADPRKPGWRRETSGSPCPWCAAKAQAAAAGDNQAAFGGHDHCGCTPAPIWR
jgi:hypothetical protein